MQGTLAELHRAPTLKFLGHQVHGTPERPITPHSHVYWEIVYYSRGHAATTLHLPGGPQTFEVAAGNIVATPPGVRHDEVGSTPYSSVYMELDAPADTPWPVFSHEGDGGRVGQVVHALLTEDRAGDNEMIPLLLRELDLLLRRLPADPASSTSTAELVRHAEHLMERDLESGIRIDDLARRLGVGGSTVRRAFQVERGTSPGNSLARLRLQRAMALLATSTLTLDVVARRCGYYSASHLTRAVKAATGMTPGAVRRTGRSDRADRSTSHSREALGTQR